MGYPHLETWGDQLRDQGLRVVDRGVWGGIPLSCMEGLERGSVCFDD